MKAVPGLYAAGEIVGGVHGRSRLANNAITEALVFGRLAGLAAVQGP
jgi:fumarate reductase flavoprotein subunit